MKSSSTYYMICACILFGAFLLDTWFTITKNNKDFHDIINSLGFFKERPWMRTLIKLPVVLWFTATGLGINGSSPAGKYDVICLGYLALVSWSIWKFSRSTNNSGKPQDT
ncbi:hypothetical protein [Paucidesulfovibrio longus]|uniref:hypothetical protein n=1 Tax=Paucidesulfovibrio longus TaxID=889 RepID=UPI0012DE6CAA|nr:hypothetical protein [Paucidesulfovibrio longus]